MMLAPKAALTVGNRLYEEQIVALRLRRTRAPGLDRLEVAMPLATRFSAEPGEDCALRLDGGDARGGGGSADVFTGQITEVRRRGDALVVVAHNGGRALARFRPVGAFEQIGVDEVIGQFCGEAAIEVTLQIDAPVLALYAADGHATALQEIARLAALAGGAAAFDGRGRLHVTEHGGPDDELALRYGRELTALEINEGRQPEETITLVGEGAGGPRTPQARWLTTDFLSGSAHAAGMGARRRRVPELRDSDDTEAAAAALAARRSAAARPVRLQTWLMPRLAPGMRLEIADLQAPLSLDDCRVTQVVSTLSPGGRAGTQVWATGRPAAGGGLLGMLRGML